MPPQSGTPAWFKERRRQLYREIRLFDDLNAVRRSISRLMDGNDLELDPQGEVHSALFLSAVVTYARQFVSSKEKDGSLHAFATKLFKSSVGFELKLHKHLLELRHKLIAHDDATVIPPWFYVYDLEAESQLGKASLTVGASVCSYALCSVIGNVFFKEIERHLTAMIETLRLQLSDDLREYVTEAQSHRDAYRTSTNDAEVRGRVPDSHHTISQQTSKLAPIEELTYRLVKTPKGANS
jgi:hypothetical protein